jgi:diaminopimelate epimerase
VSGIRFAKGHGTGNNFIIWPDADIDPTADQVRALCDRRTGIGADGLLRIESGPNGFVMDYRNADGSLAEMCGNGIRVFARYLVSHGLAAPGVLVIGTRGGPVQVLCPAEGDIEVHMGEASVPRARAIPVVTVGELSWSATGVLIPNPHAVVFVDDLADAGDLADPPEVAPGVFPDGVNVEFVVDRGVDHIAMRVHERGVGETQSCGTGACAAAWAWRRRDGEPTEGTTRVDVPGGSVWVREDAAGAVTLIGPAVIVAEGELDRQWWAGIG